MVIGEQSLESGVDGVDVCVLRFLEVDIRQYPPEHGRERNGTGDFTSAHFGLACGAGQYFDSYVFEGSKESVRKQIGMAVPCRGAQIIFEAVLKTLREYPMKVLLHL